MSDVPILIISIIASLVLLGGLAGLLFTLDGRLTFDNGIVTLNTLVAIISTANKASILCAPRHRPVEMDRNVRPAVAALAGP